MSWRLEVRHTTTYHYDRAVVASYNEARMTPASTSSQKVIEAHIDVEPLADLFAYTDYWGTKVHAFDVHDPHRALKVTGSAVVETDLARTALEDLPWEELVSETVAGRFYEYLERSRYVDPGQLEDAALAIRSRCPSPAGALPAVVEWVNGQLVYQPGATHAQTSATEAWQAGLGVCQDFAHLSLGALRAMGIPARYVSGYFYPGTNTDVGSEVTGESHAWAEAWLGDWAPIDPTNRVPVGERHVVVARGRDYADVAPLRGIYSGPSGSRAEVTVQLRRLR